MTDIVPSSTHCGIEKYRLTNTILWINNRYQVLALAMGANYRVGSHSGSTRKLIVVMCLTTPKTQPIGNGPVSLSKT
jgi:hypothetical protein